MACPQSAAHSEHIHLLWHGVTRHCSVDICSNVVHHMLQGDNLLPHTLSCGLQGNLCSSVFNTTSPRPSSLSLVSTAMFLTFFSLHSAAQWFLFFLKYVLPEVPLSWLLGSTVPYSGSTGAVWNQLCPVQDSLVLSSQRPPLQPPLSNTLPRKPSTNIMTSLATFFNKCRRQGIYTVMTCWVMPV